MDISLYMKRFSFFFVLFVLFSLSANANETEIRYRISGVKDVYLVWGVNDWQKYKKELPNTTFFGKVMRTVMVRDGNEYVAKLDIDSGNLINFGFMYVKKEGPFGIKVEYWDMDDSEDKKGYFARSEQGRLINITADVSKILPKGNVALNSYAKYLLLVFGLSALFLFVAGKYYYKNPKPVFSQAGYFISISAALMLAMFFIRAHIAGLLYSFLIDPFTTLSQMFGAAWDDIKYTSILFTFFGLLFLVAKKMRRFILTTYSVVAFFSIIAALANIRVMLLLGRPFNYQWLYYSDFLQSRDASLAMAANVTGSFISGSIMMLLAFTALIWLLYQLYLKKNLPILLLLPLLFVVSLLTQINTKVPPLKAANPVLFFIESMGSADAAAVIDKSYAGKSDFDKKNIDSLPANYATLFSRQKIKNVVFLVLESTPWEYVGPYSSTIKATPFLDSCKEKAVFENIYAHIPATNKSMFSFLCSSYPEISFKSLTLENPNIPLPSIPSELKQYGYRTVFFNSGDNGYQNAGGFLKGRGFAEVEDFHTSPCSNQVFKDKRYSKNNLDGVDDSCLSVRLLNWIATDTSKPFFVMMWTFQTHYPYFVTGPEKNYNTGNPSLEKYLNALSRADKTLQQIVEGLKQKGLLESTLIVVSGDHGEAFGRHDQTTHASAAYEENLHVPFILINPTLFNGERMPAIGGISDIAPTIFSVLNKPAPAMWQGENLFSVNRRKRVYFFNPYSDYLFGLREGNLKLIYNATDNTYKLFDLVKDPHEIKDIAKENDAFVKDAGNNLRAWMYYQDQYMKNVLNKKLVNTDK
jgi:lipoteichoic acid synthase